MAIPVPEKRVKDFEEMGFGMLFCIIARKARARQEV